jgi:hypothetical protein
MAHRGLARSDPAMIWLPRWVGVFLGPVATLFGVMMAFLGWWRWDAASTLAARGVTTTAQVISAHEVVEDGEPAVYVTLEYVVAAETIRREERVAPDLYDGGDTIEVVYDPQNPHEHMVAGTRIERGDIGLQIGIGALAAVAGVFVFFWARRRED